MSFLEGEATINGYGGSAQAWADQIRLSIRNNPKAWKETWHTQCKSGKDGGKGRPFITCLCNSTLALKSGTASPGQFVYELTHGENALSVVNAAQFCATSADVLWASKTSRGESRRELDSAMDAARSMR